MLTQLYPHYTLLRVSVHKETYPGSTDTFCAVAYPGIFSGGGGIQQIQLRTEERQNGDLGAVAPSQGFWRQL